MSQTIEVFIQGEGLPKIKLIKLPEDAKVRDLIAAASSIGLTVVEGESTAVFLEDADEPLDLEASLSASAIRPRCRVHLHRCRRVQVTVNFGTRSEGHPFSPAATVQRVKAWAVKTFGLSEVDASEHVLQICQSQDQRPADDVHIGALVSGPHCLLCFDLVPKQRVEG